MKVLPTNSIENIKTRKEPLHVSPNIFPLSLAEDGI